jgi:hypothetical protein
VETDESKHTSGGDGRRKAFRAERSGKTGNKLDRIQKRLRASENILFLFVTMDVIFEEYNQSY